MGRKALAPWYSEDKKGYFTSYQGKQRCLAKGPRDEPNGPTYLEALAAFTDLMKPENAADAPGRTTFNDVCDLWEAHLVRRGRESTRKLFASLMKSARARFGDSTPGAILPYQVDEWLTHQAAPCPPEGFGRRRGPWSQSTQRTAINLMTTALRWAVDQRFIPSGRLPSLASFRHLQQRSRGGETIIPPDHLALILDAQNGAWRDLIVFLADTGCRPAEAFAVEARYFNREQGCVVYPAAPRPDEFTWKNARKTDRPRFIYLAPRPLDVVTRLTAERPSGPIFRGRTGEPYHADAAGRLLASVCQRAGLPPYTLYSFRHTFATRAVRKGLSYAVLASMMGTSARMLEKHYSHLHTDPAAMREWLERMLGA